MRVVPSIRLTRTALVALVAYMSTLLASCGGGGDSGFADEPFVERFDPLVVRSDTSRAFRMIGRGLGRRGDRVLVRFVARTGTPFRGGTAMELEATAIVDSDRQIRGTVDEPGVPRSWGDVVGADVEIRLADGREVRFADPGARFAPQSVRVDAISPSRIEGTPSSPATLHGSGFGTPGTTAKVLFFAIAGTPFHDGTLAVDGVYGTVVSDRRIDFHTPEVSVSGSWFARVEVRLEDGTGASSDRWYACFEGPPPPPEFAAISISPVSFDARVPSVFQVAGSEFQPLGGEASVVFVAEDGTPFHGGTSDRVEVPALIAGPGSLRGLSPVPGFDHVRFARVRVRLPDGREQPLTNDRIVFVPHVGTPRVCINEIDYDQPGTDTGEFVELFNAGDGTASLGEYALMFVNGGSPTPTPYQTVELPAVALPPGGYFVVAANADVIAGADLDVSPDVNLVQNGAPDVVALRRESSVVDVVSYEGDAAFPYLEGTGVGLEDDGVEPDVSIARFLDGGDTQRNASDFDRGPATPGRSNTGRTESLRAVGDLGAVRGEGHWLALSPSDARGLSLGVATTGVGLGGVAITSDGRVFATTRSDDGESVLLVLSPADGAVILAVGVVQEGGVPQRIADLAIRPADGALFAVADDAHGAGRLVRISEATAVASTVGALALGAGERVAGLAFAPDGTLWMTTRGVGARLIDVAPTNAAVRSSMPLTVETTTGLAVRPTDGVRVACVEGSETVFAIDDSGGAIAIGATGCGEPGDLAFVP